MCGIAEALKLYKNEADKGNALARYEIGDLYRREIVNGSDANIQFKTALEGFLEVETKMKLKAYIQYRIGRMYYDGYGTERDYTEAFQWLKKAADGGNHYAEFTVGKMLLHGQGVKKDSDLAAEYLKKASDVISSAFVTLGKIYTSKDEPVMRNKAIDCFSKAAALGSANGAYNLYITYRDSKTLQRKAVDSLRLAVKLYEKQKGIYSSLQLGRIYADTKTEMFNFEKAGKNLLNAAKSSQKSISQTAEYSLGKLYYKQGEEYYAEALKWLECAFSHGNVYAAVDAAQILADSKTHLYNIRSAAAWLFKALNIAEKNNPQNDLLVSELNYKLGKLYLNAEFYYPQAAEECLKKSISFGNSYAMYALAKLYINNPDFKNLSLAISLLNNSKSVNPSISSYSDFSLGTVYMFEKEVMDLDLAKEHLAAAADRGNIAAQKLLSKQEEWTQTRASELKQSGIIKLMGSVSTLLAENVESSRADLSESCATVFGHGDLSKEQIKELLLKMQDKENTAEM